MEHTNRPQHPPKYSSLFLCIITVVYCGFMFFSCIFSASVCLRFLDVPPFLTHLPCCSPIHISIDSKPALEKCRAVDPVGRWATFGLMAGVWCTRERFWRFLWTWLPWCPSSILVAASCCPKHRHRTLAVGATNRNYWTVSMMLHPCCKDAPFAKYLALFISGRHRGKVAGFSTISTV